MSTSPIDQRTIELRLLGTPEQAEELAFLEDYQKWKANGGPDQVEQKRNKERWRQLKNTHETMVKCSRKI